jgi:hypothetical protein
MFKWEEPVIMKSDWITDEHDRRITQNIYTEEFYLSE